MAKKYKNYLILGIVYNKLLFAIFIVMTIMSFWFLFCHNPEEDISLLNNCYLEYAKLNCDENLLEDKCDELT